MGGSFVQCLEWEHTEKTEDIVGGVTGGEWLAAGP